MIALQPNQPVAQHSGISVLTDDSPHSASDLKEFIFWKTNDLEKPEGDLFDNIVAKAYAMQVFKYVMPLLKLSGSERVLEMGSGHGWVSILVKRTFPS